MGEVLIPLQDQPLVPCLFTANVSTKTQFQAGNPTVVATAISDHLNDQSGLLSGVGAGLAVGGTSSFLAGTKFARTDRV